MRSTMCICLGTVRCLSVDCRHCRCFIGRSKTPTSTAATSTIGIAFVEGTFAYQSSSIFFLWHWHSHKLCFYAQHVGARGSDLFNHCPVSRMLSLLMPTKHFSSITWSSDPFSDVCPQTDADDDHRQGNDGGEMYASKQRFIPMSQSCLL